ncbi:uncharacterized protein EDB91DRAFT_1129467 [Suillus paluster]|uniref:uncharacterized protein n=1 Tax=Suillus paluster TaxID=48578 RepID=UPI001B88051A|nr:uncharacterized protein EDB91DRAFT_1129467 [Suillus paluster]KAG1741805.1 hypothetical protein EDB91DRAFT_1129467 [Suillus paluster]
MFAMTTLFMLRYSFIVSLISSVTCPSQLPQDILYHKCSDHNEQVAMVFMTETKCLCSRLIGMCECALDMGYNAFILLSLLSALCVLILAKNN